MARAGWFADKDAGESPCRMVDDMGCSQAADNKNLVDYLKAMGLPAPSVITPQDFWMAATTESGMGT